MSEMPSRLKIHEYSEVDVGSMGLRFVVIHCQELYHFNINAIKIKMLGNYRVHELATCATLVEKPFFINVLITNLLDGICQKQKIYLLNFTAAFSN